MSAVFTPRRRAVLKAIVQTYIAVGQPVPSEAIVRQHGLGVSPATVRNEMAVLEEEGYIRRPHPSAGGVPSPRGYRYYVEYLAEPAELSESVKTRLRKRFTAADRDVEVWARLAAESLADLLRGLAVSILPRVKPVRLRHLDLVALEDLVALLVVVLEDAEVRKELFPLEQPVAPHTLEQVASRLTALISGRGRQEIALLVGRLSPFERRVIRAVLRILKRAEADDAVEWATEGLAYLLSHPDVASLSQVRSLVRMVEGGRLTQTILSLAPERGMRLVIGDENPEDALHPFSVVVAPYGTPSASQGYLALVAPMRLAYPQAVAGVGYIATLLTELVASLHPKPSWS
ncbi:MAG: heat-inducible transcriptional repressor HrcA [Dehalococcoidia bacterium]|nr:heat-inducible transcriptional repressor HrcA [Dehalococcoidia bacterium]MDW8120180.1 heat-inducible transcriptional repressor HrcA [Chloroflexota bacterium]